MNSLKDIKPPIYFKGEYIALIIIAIIILIALLSILTIFLIKKLKKSNKQAQVIKKLAHEIAYEELNALRAKNFPAIGKIKEYYIELSSIIRKYIENRFKIKAPEMTTEEFLFTLKDSQSLTSKQKDLLHSFLTLSDIVKFAKYGPGEKEIEDSFFAAENFVIETKAIQESAPKA